MTLPEMPTNASTSQTSDSASKDTAIDNAPVVRRRRSIHRPRRSNVNRRSTEERERKLKRNLELKILLIVAPSLLVIVGGILWAVSNANPDESMRPKGLINLSYYMLGIGLTIGIVALFTDWAHKILKIRKEKREKAAANTTLQRRRSSHRRHRSR